MMGLSFPILLGLVIGFFFGWLVLLKFKLLFISLIALVLGYKSIAVFIGFNAPVTFAIQKQPNSIRVVSWNVARFIELARNNNSGSNTRKKMLALLKDQQADVLCLQEYYRQDKPTDFEVVDSLFSIMGNRNYHERSAHKRSTRQNYGIAMFSKYPIIAKGDVMFESQGSNDFNYCIYADIIKQQDTFRVYNVQLSLASMTVYVFTPPKKTCESV